MATRVEEFTARELAEAMARETNKRDLALIKKVRELCKSEQCLGGECEDDKIIPIAVCECAEDAIRIIEIVRDDCWNNCENN